MWTHPPSWSPAARRNRHRCPPQFSPTTPVIPHLLRRRALPLTDLALQEPSVSPQPSLSPSSRHPTFRVAEAVSRRAPRMNVVKRDGRKEPVMFDKITARISKLCVPSLPPCIPHARRRGHSASAVHTLRTQPRMAAWDGSCNWPCGPHALFRCAYSLALAPPLRFAQRLRPRPQGGQTQFYHTKGHPGRVRRRHIVST